MTDSRFMLTRSQVAARLSISTSSVRRLEHVHIHPQVDDRGVWRFDSAEVEGFALRHPRRAASSEPRVDDDARVNSRRGRLAARVFRMFARDMSLPQIVVITGQPPDVIRELYREWSTSLFDGEWERE